MKKICLQAGHQNCQYNSIVALRRSTGAPNEMSFNVDIRDKVANELRKRGFEVVTTDANANDDSKITKVDFDLFLAIHYDADIYGSGGGFVDVPDPSVDAVNSESLRISQKLEYEYFNTTKIANRPNRRNANTKFYYMWKFLTPKTPCNIIECGVGMHVPDDHQMLHFNRPVVVEGLVRGICSAFGVEYDQPGIPTDCDEVRKQNAKLLEANVELTQSNQELRETVDKNEKLYKTNINIIKLASNNLLQKFQEFIAQVNQF